MTKGVIAVISVLVFGMVVGAIVVGLIWAIST